MTLSDATPPWPLPDPFVHRVTARADDLDVFRHVNHAVYMRWLQDTAWAHSRADGVDETVCEAEDKGVALVHAEIDHLAHGRAGDAIDVAVWITSVRRRLRAERRFVMRRASDGVDLLRARWDLACFDLSTGRPARMPDAFIAHYRVSPHVELVLKEQDRA